MGRRELRDVAVKFIFQYDFLCKAGINSGSEEERSDYELDNIIDRFIESVYDEEEEQAKKAKESDEYEIYFKPVIKGVLDKKTDIDGYIARNSREWDFSRIGKMDLAILRVAVYELLDRPDIPEVVTINEAIELSKKYSSEKAGVYINGVLGGIYTEIEQRKEGKI